MAAGPPVPLEFPVTGIESTGGARNGGDVRVSGRSPLDGVHTRQNLVSEFSRTESRRKWPA